MKRVVVLGRGGASKSTFATRLGAVTGLPVIELDKHFWPPSLTPIPRDQSMAIQRCATMCYVETIGVRELRQNASRYLARVRAGEVVGVTQRGRLVARLVPVTTDPWADLIAAGEVIPAQRSREDLLATPPRDYGFSGSEELQRLRRDER